MPDWLIVYLVIGVVQSALRWVTLKLLDAFLRSRGWTGFTAHTLFDWLIETLLWPLWVLGLVIRFLTAVKV